MTAQSVTITNDQQMNPHTLWWRPLFASQRKMNDSIKQLYCNAAPIAPFIEIFWDAEETMFHAMQSQMQEMFSATFNQQQMFLPWLNGKATEPYLDIINGETCIEIKADMAGLEPEDIDVFIEDHAIRITGCRSDKKNVDEQDYIRHECRNGTFSRVVALPEDADTSNASASLDHHVLTVRIPKKDYDEALPEKQIHIDQRVPTLSKKTSRISVVDIV